MPAIGRDWSQAGVTGLYSQVPSHLIFAHSHLRWRPPTPLTVSDDVRAAQIKQNGYHFLYLTSRAIGQARARALGGARICKTCALGDALQASSTRSFLQGLEQKGIKLPEGTIFMSPDRQPPHTHTSTQPNTRTNGGTQRPSHALRGARAWLAFPGCSRRSRAR